MTENLAGRGEGLAGLREQVEKMRDAQVAEAKRYVASKYLYAEYMAGAKALEMVLALIGAALEAAAPASTAGICPICYHSSAALATPSPQAPGTITVNQVTGPNGPFDVPAATQEQPAGNGASEQENESGEEMALELSRDNDEWTEVLLFPKRGFYRVRAVGAIPPLGTFCGAKELGDYSCAECGFGLKEPCKHWKAMLAPGSPRKVGEEAPEQYERTHSRVWINAWNAAIEECAKHLREGWSVANKDNGDDVMEVLMEELGGLMLPTPSIVGGPSSVPVGEQK